MHFKKERKIRLTVMFRRISLIIMHEVWVGNSSWPLSRLGRVFVGCVFLRILPWNSSPLHHRICSFPTALSKPKLINELHKNCWCCTNWFAVYPHWSHYVPQVVYITGDERQISYHQQYYRNQTETSSWKLKQPSICKYVVSIGWWSWIFTSKEPCY